jgi:hypothetical protein
MAQQPLGAMAYAAHIYFRNQKPQGAKHMSRLGSQPKSHVFCF